MKHICPNCGTEVGNTTAHGITFVAATGVVTDRNGRTCRLTAQQLDILERLLDAYPRAIASEQLHAMVYADRADSDTPASNVIDSHVSHIRKRFRESGVAIDLQSNRGRNAYNRGWGIVLSPEAETKTTEAAA